MDLHELSHPTADRPARRPRALRGLVLGGVAVASLLVAGCGSDDTATASADETTTTSTTVAPIPEVEVAVHGGDQEFAFDTDLTTVPAGPVKVTLTNHGTLEHQAMLVRLEDGVDLARFAQEAAADTTGLKVLDLIDGYGGPNLAAPDGGTSSSTQTLDAGNYLLICFIPGPDGTPHAAKGMVKPFTVTEAEHEPAKAVKADISLLDFAFSTQSLHAGRTITVVNKGKQPHEIGVYRLHDGATFEEFKAATAAGKPQPADPAGGLGLVKVGGTASFTAPAAGRYVLVCFMPDVAGSGAPHFMLGMMSEVTIAK
jgi:plastocyanin